MPEDTEFRLQMSNAGLSGSAIMVDEWREQNGFDPLPNGAGQVLFVPYASIPTKPEELTQTMRESGLPTVATGMPTTFLISLASSTNAPFGT